VLDVGQRRQHIVLAQFLAERFGEDTAILPSFLRIRRSA